VKKGENSEVEYPDTHIVREKKVPSVTAWRGVRSCERSEKEPGESLKWRREETAGGKL